jgi:hypothetical protein
MKNPAEDPNELLPIYVPRYRYAEAQKRLRPLYDDATNRNPDEPHQQFESTLSLPLTSSIPIQPITVNGWPADDLREYCRMTFDIPTLVVMHAMACVSPGKRITFQDVVAKMEITPEKAKGEIAQFTKLIRRRWNRKYRWALDYVQQGSKLLYFASPALADVWLEVFQREVDVDGKLVPAKAIVITKKQAMTASPDPREIAEETQE